MSSYFNKKIFSSLLALVIVFSIFGFTSRAEAAIARVQTVADGVNNANSVSAIWPISTTSGNLLVAIIAFRGGSGVTITVPSGGWTLASRSNSTTTVSTAIYYIANASPQSGSSSWGLSSSQRATLRLIEYSGMATVSVLDKTATSSGVSATGNSGTTVATTQADEVAVAGISANNSGRNFSAQTNGFTAVGTIASGGGANGEATVFEEKILSTTGAQSVGTTISTSSTWAGTIATFKALLTYTLTYTAGANGSIVGTTPQTVNYGASGTLVTATPALGYHFTSWSDGVLTATRTDTNVQANISVTASFDITNNPVPVTTSIYPSSKNVGDTNLSITVNGTNFVSGSVVNFGGSPRATTFVSDTELTSTILASDLSSTGSINVTVFNPTPGGGTSNIQILSVVNPVPTTTLISSTSKTSGDVEFTMTVSGTNFVSGSVVNFAGSARATTYVSATQLTATIPATDLITAGTFDITVFNGTPGGGTSNAQTFTVDPGVVHHFTLNDNTSMHVGSRALYTVSRFDAHNNAVTSGDLDVYLYQNLGLTSSTVFYDSATGGAVISSLVIATGTSSKNFYLYSNDAGDYNIDVTVSDATSLANGNTGIIDATDTIAVSAAPITASRFVISDTTSTVVGANASIGVKALDGAGNIDTTYNGSVTLHTAPAGPGLTPGGIVTIANGIGSINIVDTKAEVATLTLEDTASSHLDVSSTKNITFTPGPTAKFIIAGPASAIAGERINFSISRKDQYNNDVTAGIDTMHLYDDAPLGTASFYDALSGGSSITSISILDGANSANVYFAGTLVGSFNVYSSDNPVFGSGILITNGTSAININPGLVASFSVEASGGGNITTKTVGVLFDISIIAKDSFNNVANGFIGTTNILSSGTLSSGGGATPPFILGILSSHSVVISNTGLFTITATNTSGGETGTSNSFTVGAAPIVATKFNIINPTDVQVGQTTTVTIEAVDNLGNRDDSFNGSIVLVASGSATGAGFVNITNGVGTKDITDSVVEIVDLSLGDVVPSTTLDFSATSDVIFSATPPVISSGGGGGVSATVTPTVSFSGRAFPQADIEIMAIKEGGKVPVSGSTSGGANGNFNVKYNGTLPSGVNSFALVVYDKNQNIAQTKIFTLGVNDKLIKTILMAPTVDLVGQIVTRGTFMGITGQAMPNYKIILMIDGVKTGQVVAADSSGNYNITYNTYPLELGTHTLRVRQVDAQGNASDYSIEKSFLIINTFIPKADLNGDGKVDIQDWSIFMARYQSTDAKNRQSLDMNSDGKVDSADLSIFIGALNNQL